MRIIGTSGKEETAEGDAVGRKVLGETIKEEERKTVGTVGKETTTKEKSGQTDVIGKVVRRNVGKRTK